jgi:protein-disulfide isomerase
MNRIAASIALALSSIALVSAPAQAASSPSDTNVAQLSSSSSTSTAASPIEAPAKAWDATATYPTDIVVGQADAPVTIVEYGSLTCPHCAAFQNKKFPELKKEWIDTGKVRLVFRNFPIDMTAMGAAALVACLPEGDRHAAVEALYKDVNAWATKPLQQSVPDLLGKTLGREITFAKDFDACVQRQDLQKEVLRPAFDANQQGVSGTPTFFINGEKLVGYSEADPRQLDNVIIRKLGAAKN